MEKITKEKYILQQLVGAKFIDSKKFDDLKVAKDKKKSMKAEYPNSDFRIILRKWEDEVVA